MLTLMILCVFSLKKMALSVGSFFEMLKTALSILWQKGEIEILKYIKCMKYYTLRYWMYEKHKKYWDSWG